VIVTIHQPEHLPWLGFFDKLLAADVFVCLDVVQYRKNYFQNRNRILTRSGPTWLTVPVRTRGHTSSTLRDMAIAEDGRWAKKYWQTLAQSYGKHPFFERYRGQLEEILTCPWAGLVELNLALIRFFLEALGIERQLILASDLGVSGKASTLLLAICQRLGASVYVSGPSGTDYLDESLFTQAGIGVRYHDFKHPVYPQAGRRDFVPLMSTLDLLMNLGPKSLGVLPALQAGGEGSPVGGRLTESRHEAPGCGIRRGQVILAPPRVHDVKNKA